MKSSGTSNFKLVLFRLQYKWLLKFNWNKKCGYFSFTNFKYENSIKIFLLILAKRDMVQYSFTDFEIYTNRKRISKIFYIFKYRACYFLKLMSDTFFHYLEQIFIFTYQIQIFSIPQRIILLLCLYTPKPKKINFNLLFKKS